ncbi:MFS transporter [Streptomyces sp. HNM0645]|uniref:MFS transporter n=1 Tax=Streptomyces sp. HNM0645 TaxID=2782343 RepID=UPI0024B6CE51|nr:MFS transporter [Streptomyces sp. HNM0645]MDI9888370.1 MFS transporter [Streptomyces sp. HNM0645]
MVITVIEGYNLIVYGTVVPLLLKDASLGVADRETGLIGGLVYIGAILGSVIAPVVAERAGRKPVLISAIGLFGLGAVATGVSVGAEMLLVARFVTGFGVGGALTTAMTVARNSAAARRASLVVTITMVGIPLGGVVASLLAIPILPAFGWRPMFFIGAGAALAVLVAVAIMEIPVNTPQEVAGRGWTVRQKLSALFRGPGAIVAVIVAVCAIANMVAWTGLNVWAAQSMIDLGYSLRGALLFTFTLAGAAVVGSFGSAWAADRHGSALLSVFTSACTLLGLAGILLLPTSVLTTILCIALMGIGGHSTMNLVHTTTADLYPLPVRATALGWSNGTSFIGAFLGPTLGGKAITVGGAHGVFVTFLLAAAVCLTAVLLLFLADRAFPHEAFRNPVGDHARRGELSVPGESTAVRDAGHRVAVVADRPTGASGSPPWRRGRGVPPHRGLISWRSTAATRVPDRRAG